MTIATLLTAMIGQYRSGLQSAAITAAKTYLGAAEGDSDAQDVACAILARNFLLGQGQAEKFSSDASVANMSQFMTKEIRDLLATPEKASLNNIFTFKEPNVAWR